MEELILDASSNFTNITNTTLTIESAVAENRYILFGMILVAIVWIKGFGMLYYWLVRDVFKLMIWHSDSELKRRLDIYTSMTYGTNIPGIIGHNQERKIGHDDVKQLLYASSIGELNSDFFAYENKSYRTPQILTKITMPGKQTSVLVENLVVGDPADGNIVDSRISGMKSGKVKINSGLTSRRSRKGDGNSQLAHDGSMADYGARTANARRGGKTGKARNKRTGKRIATASSATWFSKMKQRCCRCFCSCGGKRVDDWRQKNTTYSQDQLSETLNDVSRYYRGNFLIVICDVSIVVGLAVIAIIVYSALDLEWSATVSPQTLVAVFGLFKLSEGFSGLIGYANIIWHDTIYRGDIVEIIGTWNSIGGKVVGVVYKVTVADVYLLTNQSFQSHFAANKAPPPPSVKKPDHVTDIRAVNTEGNATSPGPVVHPHDDDADTETIQRYVTLGTAFRVPNIRVRAAAMSDEDFHETFQNASKEHRAQSKIKRMPRSAAHSDHESLEMLDEDVLEYEDDSGEEESLTQEGLIGYVKLNQEISGGNDSVPIRVERFAETVDRVRLNTNAVYLASIYTKIGWSTNLKAIF